MSDREHWIQTALARFGRLPDDQRARVSGLACISDFHWFDHDGTCTEPVPTESEDFALRPRWQLRLGDQVVAVDVEQNTALATIISLTPAEPGSTGQQFTLRADWDSFEEWEPAGGAPDGQ